MIYFQVNENCNGCLSCVQNCPARALEAREEDGVQTLLHNMSRCARCATCWRVCPQQAIEFQHLLKNRWDAVVTHKIVYCSVCGERVQTARLTEKLDPELQELAEPLCSAHKRQRQAGLQIGRRLPAGGAQS